MKKLTPVSKTAGKVIIGFFLAAIFLIGVAGLTYYTLNRLLLTMEELAQPNQKLNILNELQSEIIQITQVGQSGAESDIRVQDSTIKSLETKLDELAFLAADSLEESYILSIRSNLATLITGYLDLYEVKKNLSSRNFTREALRKVELGIRRRAANMEMRPLQQLNPRDKMLNELEQQKATRSDPRSGTESQEDDKLISYLRDLQRQNLRGNAVPQTQTLDSILYNIRGVINRIYREEAAQRQTLADMESELSINQSDIIGTIQNLVATLQRRALEESDRQNQSAAGLTYDVTFFLIMVVLFAILGSAVMVYSILKEIKLNKKYQENLEISRQKSDELARSKQEFLANMSHEIRNPLHVIQGYRSVLEKSKLDSGQKSHLRMIGFASDTLMEIVDEVLDFSKLEAGKLKLESRAFDPESLFGSVQNFFELQATEKNLDFEWTISLPDGKWLKGDQLRLKQILNNLLSNAFKFTSQGKIQVNVGWVQDTLTVEISDTGIGMNPKVLEKVFLEFDQADTSISRKYGGTGLGLAIVQRLVVLMGGKITAKSEENKGTSMHVELPMIAVQPLATDLQLQEVGSLDLEGKTILLVDDDKIGIRYLETILSYFGATIISYTGGSNFRDEFVEVPLDLAILDIQMPEFSGFDVVQKLRVIDRYQTIPVLAMTANVFVEERDKMIEAGFDEIIFKPFQESTLIQCIGGFFPENRIFEGLPNRTETAEEHELFELKDLRRFCMGDEQILQDILKELIMETRKDMQKLKRARLNDNYDQILEICHQLGSRLGQIKNDAGLVARKIENSLKLGNHKGVSDLLNQLETEVIELLNALAETIDDSEKILN